MEAAASSSPLRGIIDPAADLEEFLEARFEPNPALEQRLLPFLFAEFAQESQWLNFNDVKRFDWVWSLCYIYFSFFRSFDL